MYHVVGSSLRPRTLTDPRVVSMDGGLDGVQTALLLWTWLVSLSTSTRLKYLSSNLLNGLLPATLKLISPRCYRARTWSSICLVRTIVNFLSSLPLLARSFAQPSPVTIFSLALSLLTISNISSAPRGFLESYFLSQFLSSKAELEPKGFGCKCVLVRSSHCTVLCLQCPYVLNNVHCQWPCYHLAPAAVAGGCQSLCFRLSIRLSAFICRLYISSYRPLSIIVC